MSDLNVNYNKAGNAKEGFQLASEFLKSHKAKAMFPVTIDFSFIDGLNPRVIGKGKGFEVTLTFYDTDVTVTLDLAFLLKPMKGKIIDSLASEIKRVL